MKHEEAEKNHAMSRVSSLGVSIYTHLLNPNDDWCMCEKTLLCPGRQLPTLRHCNEDEILAGCPLSNNHVTSVARRLTLRDLKHTIPAYTMDFQLISSGLEPEILRFRS
ncbi:hypothetical protein AVEN_2144-1 [Araneus ventricosus]|uniref:Uncharacterized protein n=1 Tax=Araneus ventricosus TaxID=182803 RepID=A0A4Y2JVT8_ARAVE|nr:hypothetical protein AVEN_2144-1 [Araneus ventricosus]